MYIFFVIEYDRGVYDIVWWLVGFGVYRFFFLGFVMVRYLIGMEDDCLFVGWMMVEVFEWKLVYVISRGRFGNNMFFVIIVFFKIVEKLMFKFKFV